MLVLQRAATGHLDQGCVLHAAIVTRLTPFAQALSHNAAMLQIRSPLQAQIVQWQVAPGDPVRAGDVVVILEAMKMEHEVRADADGRVVELLFAVGDQVDENELLLISELLAARATCQPSARYGGTPLHSMPSYPRFEEKHCRSIFPHYAVATAGGL